MKRLFACAVAVLIGGACGGEEALPLVVAWKFKSGDCTTNAVDKVRVTVTPQGAAPETAEVACAEGRTDMGVFPAGTYGIRAEGLDATGRVVASDFGTSTTFGDSGPFGDLEVTLHPKAADVVVTWSPSCPSGVVLPYFIAVYRPPPQGSTDLTDKVKEVQESCSSGTATVPDVAPGDYVVEVDSRAITPKVRGTQDVTVKPGEDAQVSFQF